MKMATSRMTRKTDSICFCAGECGETQLTWKRARRVWRFRRFCLLSPALVKGPLGSRQKRFPRVGCSVWLEILIRAHGRQHVTTLCEPPYLAQLGKSLKSLQVEQLFQIVLPLIFLTPLGPHLHIHFLDSVSFSSFPPLRMGPVQDNNPVQWCLAICSIFDVDSLIVDRCN